MSGVNTISPDSAPDDSPTADEGPVVTWTHPKRNLWVAFRSGHPTGSVELVAEHFVSCDVSGKHRGSHPDLCLAQRAVESGW
jgi:hypothetical protein